MEKHDFPSRYVGMNIHKNLGHAVVKTEKGEIVKEDRVKTYKDNLIEFFEDINEEFKFTMKACGNYEFFYEALEELASEVPVHIRHV